MRLLAFAVLLGLSFEAAAAPACWTVSEVVGQGAYYADHYQINPDGFTGKSFRIVYNGDQSTVTDWGVTCTALPGNTVMCGKTSWQSNTSSIELWVVDDAAGMARMVRTHSGYGVHDSASVFVGKAARCN